MPFDSQQFPAKWFISPKNITRMLVVLVVLLALIAGYFQTTYIAEQKKYLRLEDRYVRVRNMLGVDQTQQLIDDSYLEEK